MQKSLHIYITHTREKPKASAGAGRTQFSSLPGFLHPHTGVMSAVQGAPTSSRWSPATAPAREMMLLPLHCLSQTILISRSGELDHSSTVKLYLLVLEQGGTKNEKSCSSHRHPRDLTPTFNNFVRAPAQQFRHKRFRILR